MESKTFSSEEEIKESAQRIFGLSDRVFSLIYVSAILSLVLYSFFASVAFFILNDYLNWANVGIILFKIFIGAWLILVAVCLMKSFYYSYHLNKIHKRERYLAFKDSIKKEILGEIRRGRRK